MISPHGYIVKLADIFDFLGHIFIFYYLCLYYYYYYYYYFNSDEKVYEVKYSR